jgi:transposase
MQDGRATREVAPPLRPRKPFLLTRDREDQLRQMYKRCRTKTELSEEVTILANTWSVPRSTVTNLAQKLGVSLLAWKTWNEEEVAFLREHSGSMSIKRMAKALKRSPDSVKHQLHRMQLSAEVNEGYSIRQLQELLGVKHTRIQMWLSRGWLRMEHERVTERSVQRFLFQRMDAYSFRNCEEAWLKGMLNPSFGMRANVRDSSSGDQEVTEEYS